MERGAASGGGGPVAIVGGGIAGMAFAIAAVERGFACEIVEADPAWRVYGAGISLTSPTFRAMRNLGVLERVKEQGFFIEKGGAICAPDGSIAADLPLHAVEPGLPTAGGIMRPALHAIMAEKVGRLGIPTRLGVTVDEFLEDAEGTTLLLSDGGSIKASCVVAADGAFSRTRGRLFPGAGEPTYTGQFCWRIIADRPPEVDRPLFFVTPEVTAGLMPVSQDVMYMWLLETSPERRRLIDDELPDRLLRLLASFSGPMEAVRKAIARGETIISRPLDALLLPLPWHRGRTVLIGDAAHATTPHLASGAGIAIEDGLALAEALADHEDPVAAFEAFERRRWERCRLVVEESVAIGRMQQTAAAPAELNVRMGRAQAALAQDI
ncbi:FAD-dependent monooxygenase [Sphingomonas sp. CLY1604]|uniref:FAD-dependent monooxygenase n=1 Tax=Sphingomonas sp. CLY1604 TaxID=3457786 RepID=UPI003FD82FEE